MACSPQAENSEPPGVDGAPMIPGIGSLVLADDEVDDHWVEIWREGGIEFNQYGPLTCFDFEVPRPSTVGHSTGAAWASESSVLIHRVVPLEAQEARSRIEGRQALVDFCTETAGNPWLGQPIRELENGFENVATFEIDQFNSAGDPVRYWVSLAYGGNVYSTLWMSQRESSTRPFPIDFSEFADAEREVVERLASSEIDITQPFANAYLVDPVDIEPEQSSQLLRYISGGGGRFVPRDSEEYDRQLHDVSVGRCSLGQLLAELEPWFGVTRSWEMEASGRDPIRNVVGRAPNEEVVQRAVQRLADPSSCSSDETFVSGPEIVVEVSRLELVGADGASHIFIRDSSEQSVEVSVISVGSLLSVIVMEDVAALGNAVSNDLRLQSVALLAIANR